jgi:hypothetical protein
LWEWTSFRETRFPGVGPQTSRYDILMHMVQRRKLITRFAVILGVVVLIPVVLFISLWLYSYATYVPSRIVDFHPSYFQAKADKYFFYSIGDELKYSDELASQAPTLMRGQIQNSLVSPDNTKIAVVANGLLVVVAREEPVIRKVASVNSIYKDAKPIGQQFFRDDDFQWSKDSKYLYLIKDEYYNSKGRTYFRSKASFGSTTSKREICSLSLNLSRLTIIFWV